MRFQSRTASAALAAAGADIRAAATIATATCSLFFMCPLRELVEVDVKNDTVACATKSPGIPGDFAGFFQGPEGPGSFRRHDVDALPGVRRVFEIVRAPRR